MSIRQIRDDPAFQEAWRGLSQLGVDYAGFRAMAPYLVAVRTDAMLACYLRLMNAFTLYEGNDRLTRVLLAASAVDPSLVDTIENASSDVLDTIEEGEGSARAAIVRAVAGQSGLMSSNFGTALIFASGDELNRAMSRVAAVNGSDNADWTAFLRAFGADPARSALATEISQWATSHASTVQADITSDARGAELLNTVVAGGYSQDVLSRPSSTRPRQSASQPGAMGGPLTLPDVNVPGLDGAAIGQQGRQSPPRDAPPPSDETDPAVIRAQIIKELGALFSKSAPRIVKILVLLTTLIVIYLRRRESRGTMASTLSGEITEIVDFYEGMLPLVDSGPVTVHLTSVPTYGDPIRRLMAGEGADR